MKLMKVITQREIFSLEQYNLVFCIANIQHNWHLVHTKHYVIYKASSQ